MSSERAMSRLVMQALDLAHLDPVRVENPAGPGTPDVNYLGGWIENKVLEKWPRDKHSLVKVPLFRPEQRIWLGRRSSAGGECWVMLKVGQEWILLEGGAAAIHLGNTWNTKDIYRLSGFAAPNNKEMKERLGQWLRRRTS